MRRAKTRSMTPAPGAASARHTKSIWRRLETDPRRDGFWEQCVSSPHDDGRSPNKVKDDAWQFPENMSGTPGRYSRTINFVRPTGDGRLTDAEFEELLRYVKTFVVAKMSRPMGHPGKLSTVMRSVAEVFGIMDFLASGPWKEGRRTLASLTRSDADALLAFLSKDWRPGSISFSTLRRIFVEMSHFADRKLVADGFAADVHKHLIEQCDERTTPSGYGHPPADRHRYSNRPLPDAYCLAVLDIADFYRSVLAMDVIAHVRALHQFRLEEKILRRSEHLTSRDPRLARLRYEEFAQHYVWPVSKLPFPTTYEFPPRTSGELCAVANSLQGANLHVYALFTAARSGEVLFTDASCMARASEKIVSSIRKKNSPLPGGEVVEWRVPQIVIDAISVQRQFAASLGNDDSIWIMLQNGKLGERLVNGDGQYFVKFAARHALSSLLEPGSNPSVQRCRTTLARLVLLAEGGHIHLVKRALGHRDIVSSIGYSHMNPFLQEELAAIRAARIGKTVTPSAPLVSGGDGSLSTDDFIDRLGELVACGELEVFLAAPGIAWVRGNGDAELATIFRQSAVASATVEFAVDVILARGPKMEETLYGWLGREVRRLLPLCADSPPLAQTDPERRAIIESVLADHP